MRRPNSLTLAISAGVLVWLWSPYGTPTRYYLLATARKGAEAVDAGIIRTLGASHGK